MAACDVESRFQNVIQDQHSHIRPNPKKQYIDLLLVGKTGNGKSSLGNSIMRREAFRCSDSMSSVTKNIMFDYCEFEDTIIKVVDGPGVGDTKLNKKDGVQLVMDAMSCAILSNPEGYHAILVVIRYGQRFTKEDVKSLQILKGIFGEGFIKDHAILVMTCGDIFWENEKTTGKTFKQWCNDQDEDNFKALLSEVGHRVVLFDNKTKDENKQSEQIRQLLAMIKALSANGKRYTSEQFTNAKKSRDDALMSGKAHLHEAALREAALITQEFQNINFKEPASEYKRFQELKARAQQLILSIEEQDKGTGVLAAAIKRAKNMENSISEEMKVLQEIMRIEAEANREKQEEEVARLALAEKLRLQEECRNNEHSEAEKRKQEEETKRREAEQNLSPQEKQEIMRIEAEANRKKQEEEVARLALAEKLRLQEECRNNEHSEAEKRKQEEETKGREAEQNLSPQEKQE